MLCQKAYDQFREIIEDYNKFIKDNHVIDKIESFLQNPPEEIEISEGFKKDVLSEWIKIEKNTLNPKLKISPN